MEQAVKIGDDMLNSGKNSVVFTPNPEIIWSAGRNERLKSALDSADLLLPDGIGVVIASKILGNPLPERVAGYDFLHKILELCADEGKKVYLLGSAEGVAEKAAENLKKQYQNLQIAGTHHGYFTQEDEPRIIKEIRDSGASLLVVCLGAPKQEIWIAENRDKTAVSMAIGVGGALDVIAGNVRRAPIAWQKSGFEWLYRAICQPSRIPRLVAIPKFMLAVTWSRIRNSKEKTG
jgi:N-acetylglucosaminyldiphosphoundecaprenol N-acetyl-beta-D-mannosaminyltransferase